MHETNQWKLWYIHDLQKCQRQFLDIPFQYRIFNIKVVLSPLSNRIINIQFLEAVYSINQQSTAIYGGFGNFKGAVPRE